ncbi:MAG: hypothetical protein ACI8XB_001813 [Patiriisocius sp.]|jgi:hypothetical protein
MPEIIDYKDTDGLFFAPEQLVYTVPSEALDLENNLYDNYQLSITADDDIIYSETDVIRMTQGSLGLPFFSNLNLVNLNATPTNETIYKVALLNFKSSKNALNHAVGFRLNYTEFYVGGDSEQKSFQSTIRTIRPLDDEGG